jgi:hypothetical protein
MKRTILTLLITMFFGGVVFADRPLERDEIVKIFETLTSQPKGTWIPSGTICAEHEEYGGPAIKVGPDEITERVEQEVDAYKGKPDKINPDLKLQHMKLDAIPYNVRYQLTNEYTMSSNVIIRYDGDRFYWEINVNSRTDSMQPTADLEDNYFVNKFDLGWNQKRVFAWDGNKYTIYFRPGNHAIITGTRGNVNGPLTAGIIPWGHGWYSYENLCQARSSAIEVESDGQKDIKLTVINDNRRETFVLDPERQYTLKSSSRIMENASITVCSYTNYQLVGNSWCPGNIVIEKHDTTIQPPRLVAQEIWNFTSINDSIPGDESFEVSFDYDALIEDFIHGSNGESLKFRYEPPQEPSVRNININELKQNRLQIVTSAELEEQNCATVSLKYVCEKLGLSPSWEELMQLVSDREIGTTMLQMQQFVNNLGLNSIAVKTDLQTLKKLTGCQVVLHLAGINHYVVLGNIGDEYVRLIDLDKNKFFYRNRIEYFSKVWDGTALIVSNGLIAMNNHFAQIDEGNLLKIMGADNCQTCSKCIQDNGEFPCPEPVGGSCGGSHVIIFRRYGCEDASLGNCVEDDVVGSVWQACRGDSSSCESYGEWESHYISACD